MDFALILLNIFLGHVLGIGAWCFPRVAVALISFSWITCYLSLFDKQRHLAGNFRGVSGRLCWIFKFCLVSFSVSAGVSFQCCIL